MQEHQSASTNDPLLPVTQAYQDHLIGELLPSWLRQGTPTQLEALKDAMSLSLYFRQRAAEMLGKLEALDSFCETLLCDGLKHRSGVKLAVRDLQFRQGRREPVLTSQPVGYPVTELVYGLTPLLEAALRNFTAEQASAGGQYPGNRLLDAQGVEMSWLPATQFAQWCRELDLGGQYQRHLASVLEPADPDERRTVQSLLARAQRYAMLADAHVARLQGALDEAELQLLVRLCGLHKNLTLNDRPVALKRLKLLGCTLEQIVVVDVRDDSLAPLYSTSLRVLVYIPGDPIAPWRACQSLRQFANQLGQHLRTADYQRFFSRFVRRRDSQAFFAQVIEGYAGVSDLANIALEEHMLAWPGPLFDSLALARIAQLKDDAAMIAVPVAALDLEQQREHDQRLLAEGWALLNLAGLFVPGIGLALLAVSAWELLGEVYHGIEAWHEGDTSEAFDHLFNVAGDLALIAATAAGGTLVRNAWTRARQVDELVAVPLENGATRLWNQDLTPYRSEPPAPGALRDELGIERLGERAWVRMDGHYYRVEEASDGAWHLRAQGGLAPRLRHNGAGAWRLWCEQPATWDDPVRMFARLGHPFDQLDEQPVQRILLSHGMDASHLRALHVHGLAADAALTDSVERQLIDQRIRSLLWAVKGGASVADTELLQQAQQLLGVDATQALPVEALQAARSALFQLVYEAGQGTDDVAVAAVRRQFPSLHARAAREVLRLARATDRQRVQNGEPLPLRLAQAARQMSHRVRISRAYEGLYLGTPQDADLARVAIGLSPGLHGAPATLGWRLFEGSTEGPLLHSAGEQAGADCYDLVHQDGRFTLFDAQGLRVHGPDELFQTLAQAYSPAQRDAMLNIEPFADHLRLLLGERALGQREAIAGWLGGSRTIGWFQAPQRLADGRLGYPLSGRGARRRLAQSLLVRLRELYPSFDDAQINAWVQSLQAQGRDVRDELLRLEHEYLQLHRHLLRWSEQPDAMMQRLERREFSDALCSAWQRRSLNLYSPQGEPEGYRLSVWATTMPHLPDLPAQVSFAHVRELSMMNMGIEHVPQGFLARFSALRVLELPHNNLTRLPEGLAELGALRELDLYCNEIVLEPEQASQLASCTTLEFINLSLNPLSRSFSLASMSNLQRLHLRATQIDSLPEGLFERQQLVTVDLRSNRITDIPEAFYTAPLSVSQHILLHENPLHPAGALRYASFLDLYGLMPLLVEQSVDLEPRQLWLDTVADDDRARMGGYWDGVQSQVGSEDFFFLLGRLVDTVDYRNLVQRPVLGGRVLTMLQAMSEHAGLCEVLFSDAQIALTCQDSVVLRFSELELRMLVWRAGVEAEVAGQDGPLLALGGQLWRLDEVDRIALEDIQARRADGADPDEVEVGLAYRLALREPLDLPAQPSAMAYGESAGLDQARIDAAHERVLAAQTPERLAVSLVQREFWQEHLRRTHAQRFETLDAPFFERQQALIEAREAIADGDYLPRMNAIRDQLQAARLALMEELTRAALAALPAPQG